MIEENKGGYITIAYNFDMLVKWTRKVKAQENNMKLKEAKEILKQNGYLIEGSYKDIIHQRLGEIRQKRDDNNKANNSKQIKLGKIMSKVYNEVKEFIDDLADELVSDKITCDYDKKHRKINIHVEDKEYIMEMTIWGEFRFKEQITVGWKDWIDIFATDGLEAISEYLDKAFDYITKESV